jgi:glutathione peroxidase
MAIFGNLSVLSGAPLEEAALQGRAVLVVNVASRCGLTPQYTGLEQLQERYGVSFPMTEKLEVNGPERHPLFRTLTATADEAGEAGDVQWNFEKFLVSADGRPVARFRPTVEPESQELTDAIESELPS